MKLFQCVTSASFRNSIRFSLKTLVKDSQNGINVRNILLNTSFLKSYTGSSYLNVNKLHTSCCVRKNSEDFPVPSTKKRLQKKKLQQLKDNLAEKTWSAVAYSSAERYNMQGLTQRLSNQDLYKTQPLPEDAQKDLHLCMENGATEPPSHIFIFSEGSIVFWNVPEPKQKEMLNFLKPYEYKSYEETVVNEEREDLDYTYSEDGTRLNDGCIMLDSKSNTDLCAYTFSNSLAQSVKLGILEVTLENYSSSIESVPDKMKIREKIKMSRRDVFAKQGELLSLRHIVNFSSKSLDTPDFYWDRKDLEILYLQTCNYLDIQKRIRTLNVKLDYCSALVDLLSNHMNDEHHVRLERIIIILIMVEVLFECIHFLERLAH